MTGTIIHYHFSLSPWAYLGLSRLEAMAHQHGAQIIQKPVNMVETFKRTNGTLFKDRGAARIAYRNLELKRWKDFLSSPIKPEPAFFPCDDTLAARTVIAAREAGEMVSPLVNAVCTALWVEDRNIADRDTLAEILVASGYDADRTLKSAQSDDIGAVYEADTAEAVALGVFGSPTYVYNGELFCGQDRLDFLKRALVNG